MFIYNAVMTIDKSWTSIPNRNSDAFLDGLFAFIKRCEPLLHPIIQKIRCPCSRCCNRDDKPVTLDILEAHLSNHGFDKHYTTWKYHGEPLPLPPPVPHSPEHIDMDAFFEDISANNVPTPPTQTTGYCYFNLAHWYANQEKVVVGDNVYTVGDRVKLGLELKLRVLWRKAKNRIKANHFTRYPSAEVAKNHLPPPSVWEGRTQEEWNELVDWFSHPDQVARSAVNAANRAKNTIPTHQGKKSFAQGRNEYKVEHGHYEDLIETWRKTHSEPKSGRWKSKENKQRYLQMKAMQDQVRGGVIPFMTDQQILDQVVPSENRQNMSGMGRKLPGSGSTSRKHPNKVFADVLTRDEMTQILRQKEQENELLRKQVEEAQQRAYLASLKADASSQWSTAAYQNTQTLYGTLGTFFGHYNSPNYARPFSPHDFNLVPPPPPGPSMPHAPEWAHLLQPPFPTNQPLRPLQPPYPGPFPQPPYPGSFPQPSYNEPFPIPPVNNNTFNNCYHPVYNSTQGIASSSNDPAQRSFYNLVMNPHMTDSRTLDELARDNSLANNDEGASGEEEEEEEGNEGTNDGDYSEENEEEEEGDKSHVSKKTMSSLKDFSPSKLSFQDIFSATNGFSSENIIRKFRFGNIYKGRLLHSNQYIDIIAKWFKPEYVKEYTKRFWTEIFMLSSLKHKNLVSVIGIYDDEDKFIVYKKEANEILEKYLSDETLTWMQRLKICAGVANALSYIHHDVERDFSVIHCNIESSKILLDDKWEPKLSGFEFSLKNTVARRHRLFLTRDIVKNVYLDPKYKKTGGMTHKSDVYSFGVVLFEVLCGRSAVLPDEELGDGLLSQLKRYHLDEMINPHLQKQMDPEAFTIFSETAYYCIQEERAKRPHIDQVVKRLEKALEHQWKRENPVDRTSFNRLK
ncbi:kinase-like domain, phloem protein 2-like protein, partial [Tanacetum coccineum]